MVTTKHWKKTREAGYEAREDTTVHDFAHNFIGLQYGVDYYYISLFIVWPIHHHSYVGHTFNH